MTKPRRILFFALFVRGGMLHYSSLFISGVAAQPGVEAEVVFAGHGDRRLLGPEVKVVPVNAPSTIGGALLQALNLVQWIRLAREIRRFNPDTLHVLDSHPWGIFIRLLAGRRRVVYTLHDPAVHAGDSETLAGRAVRLINRTVSRLADTVIVHGEVLKRQACEAEGLDPKKVVVLPHGDYAALAGIPSPIPDSLFLLFFGRIVRYKGIDTLLAAVSSLISRYPGLKLVIAGEGDFAPYAADAAKLGGNLELLNRFVPDEELPALLARARMVVLPYDEATQSGVIPLALAAERPVVATAVGGIPEVITTEKTGLLVPPRDPEKLAEAISRLLDDPALGRKLAREGRAWMEANLSWSEITARYLDLTR